MNIGIITDSCCDLTTEMRDRLQAARIPLKIMVADEVFVDNKDIDLPKLRDSIRRSKTAPTTACPAPGEYAEAMRRYDECFVVTLSSRLSGSYNSAEVARTVVLEESPEKKIHVVDSRSASSGEVSLALQLSEMIAKGMSYEDIVFGIEAAARNMRTLFVLDNLDALMKSGRLNKVVGTVATLLSMRPIMSENGNGEIIMLDKVRGTQKALVRLTELVAGFTKDCAERSVRLVLAHCNCAERSETLRTMLLEGCPALSEVLTVATNGLSTVYANEGGVIIAFQGNR